MIPGEMVETIYQSLPVYQRGKQGTGAVPGSGATITLPAFSTVMRAPGDILNGADNGSKRSNLGTLAASMKRFAGIWWVDVNLFQNGPATIQLFERTYDLLTNVTSGLTNTFQAVWTRQVRTSAFYRATWRLTSPETRIVYTNGATAITIFDFSVVLRSQP